jgi:outer membrane cobalamin receptor
LGETGLRGAFRRERGRGDYPFRFFDGVSTTELNRSGGDFSMVKGEVMARYGEEADFSASATATFTEADRGSPGPVTDPSSVGRARLYDKISEIRGRVRYRESSDVEVRMNFTGRLTFERYTDPGILLNGAITNSEYTNRDYLVGPEFHYGVSPAFTGTAGLEWGRATLKSNDTRDAFREQRSVFLSTQHQFELPWEIPFEIILYPSVRFDSYSDVENGISPKIGVNIGLLREPATVRLRSSLGRSYHAPVFNDLYWKAGGNPDLKPEHAISFDAGFVADVSIGGGLHLETGYFDIRANNHVTWIPGAGGFWSPRNIREVTSRGVEAEGSWTSTDSVFTLTVNSTWTDARKKNADFPGDPSAGKRLIYVPAQTALIAGEVHLGWGTLMIRNFWSSYRYTTEVNDHFLRSYATTSAALRFGLPLPPARASFTLEFNNLFNTSYEIVALYPMPLREVRGTMEVTL